MPFASATSLSHIRRTATFSLRRKASSITSSQSVRTIAATTQGVTKQVPYHRPPEKPMLVVALRNRDETLSLVAVDIDYETDMKRTWWDYSDQQQQLKAHIIRGGTDLQIRRWTDEFNIAKLGIDQKYQAQNVANWAGVKRLSLQFNSVEGEGARWLCSALELILVLDRKRFAGHSCNCDSRLANDVANCHSQGHRGLFGKIRQIGIQRLNNYHELRREAMKTTIGPIQESAFG